MRTITLCAAIAVVAVPARARAQDEVPDADWKEHRRGPHMFVEGGMGAVYAPGLQVTFAGSGAPRLTDAVFVSGDFVGPAALLRWGVDVGVSPAVDVRVGIGSFLGASIHSVTDEFFGLPHAHADVSFGPGEVYRFRVGAMAGALVLELDSGRRSPGDVHFAGLGEVSPLVIHFGNHGVVEFALTQGAGVFVGEQGFGSCPADAACSGVVQEPETGAVFAAHTKATFGGVF